VGGKGGRARRCDVAHDMTREVLLRCAAEAAAACFRSRSAVRLQAPVPFQHATQLPCHVWHAPVIHVVVTHITHHTSHTSHR
jgi:hypothetical protein